MITSPLQLNKYFFTKIHIDASPEHCGEMGTITANVSCAHKNDNEREWLVTLKVILDNNDSGDVVPPYTGEIEVLGFFEVAKKFPKERLQMLVHCNAPAMLYGAVREMVFNLTSRGPNSHINLPTVSFIDDHHRMNDDKTPPKKSLKEPKKRKSKPKKQLSSKSSKK